MRAADAEEHGDSPSPAVSATATHGTFTVLEGTGSFRLGDDLEPTQIVHIACHCCKAANTLICSKTPDGAWLLCRAPVTSHAGAAIAGGDVEGHADSTSFDTEGDPGEGPSGTADVDSWATDSEKEREQERSIKVTVHPAPDGSGQKGYASSREEQGSDVEASQASQPGTSLRIAVQPAAATTAEVGGASALAIAAPEPKRDASKAARDLRPLARNSNSSTCSSWEGGEARAGDEPSSPLGVASPIHTTPIREFRGPDVISRGQEKENQQLYEPEREQTPANLFPQQQPSVSHISSSSSSCKDQRTSDGVLPDSCTRVKERQQHCGSYRNTWKKAHSDGETSENSPKLAAFKELQQKPKPKQLQHADTGPPEAEEGGRQCSQTCSSNGTDDSGSNGIKNSSSSKKPQQDSVIAAMAPYMLTRECEGDGNCLYRAFSDQLYGSQEHHLFLRKLAVDVMLRCKDTFEAFVDESEGPFERWLQTKRTYGEWADYREMHALLLLFGTPIFVFDEHLQLLQAFEPDSEKRRPPSQEGEFLTPFRLMWHGKLGHYTSLHYVKEGFPIARGLTIGELEAEGLARLVLSAASGSASDGVGTGGPSKPSKEPTGTPAGLEEEALAECLQVSAQELAGIAAEQELILATIKKQRLQQLLPQTTKIVNELWNEAKKEQEAWSTRVAKCIRSSPSVAPAMDPSQHHGMLGRANERRLPSTGTAACAAAAEGSNASVHGYYPSGRAYASSISGISGSPISVPSARIGEPSVGELQRMGGPAGGLWRESRPGQTVRYDRPQQQIWQEQLHLRQQATAVASPPIVCHSQGPSGPVVISSPVGPARVQPTGPGLPASTATRGFMYTHQFAPQNEFVEQQRHCVRLSDGRLVALAPSGVLGPVRHVTLQQQRQAGQQQPHLLPARAAAVNGQRQSANSSSTSPTEEAPWFVRWMGSGSNPQGR
ncbi:OTU-like cysteine protease domain-containing protein, putative [Eimeria praecox]|uniref:OTU-like cysteine protease domain-containing protein, putative n=1 Tax=Eimeria praecox TaxID=51316 RepID=U6GIZ3_9EIME|nr:OTU-like cysteine protease domain-containing protein, putative [Eimeria praecox]